MLFKKIVFTLTLLLACFVFNGFGQAPTQIKKKCPNVSIYSIVAITAVGDINVQPCTGRSTIFTQNIVLPSGGGTITGSGMTGNPNLAFNAAGTITSTSTGAQAFRASTYDFQNAGATSEFKFTMLAGVSNGSAVLGDCATTPTSCLNLSQSAASATLNGSVIELGPATGTAGVIQLGGVATFTLNRTITPAGTTGTQVINKPAGIVNVAAAAASIVVTNSTVTSSSIVLPVIRTADATCTFVKSLVSTTGSFTITLNAACGAETSIGFLVTN